MGKAFKILGRGLQIEVSKSRGGHKIYEHGGYFCYSPLLSLHLVRPVGVGSMRAIELIVFSTQIAIAWTTKRVSCPR
jgi:hypothetical protein